GMTVTLYADGKSVGTAVANTSGTYTITVNTTLANGAHTITATQTDVTGHVSAASAARTITVDAIAPTVSITSTPPTLTSSTSATFTFTGTDNLSALANMVFQTSLDGAAFVASATPLTYTGLAAGNHTFRIRSEDQAGNFSIVANYLWTVKTTLSG